VQVLDDPDRVGPRQPTDATGDARGPVHDPQVGVHPLGDVGSLHLDDRPTAVVEHAGVDLGGRRRREGHLVELGERLGEGEAEVGFDHGAPPGRAPVRAGRDSAGTPPRASSGTARAMTRRAGPA
jgi:hypothetical protein